MLVVLGGFGRFFICLFVWVFVCFFVFKVALVENSLKKKKTSSINSKQFNLVCCTRIPSVVKSGSVLMYHEFATV